ncbi:MAG: fibronectin type III domain-containing protein [Clostridia bacterium]|nr:fibronectin type III domain-containing protein [Clostridia bacterium]
MQVSAHGSNGIFNNGLGGIYINIYGSIYEDSRWWAYGAPYGQGGCTWFVGARVMELTGKGTYNTQVGSTWYNYYGSNLGFSKGQSPQAGSVICWSGHVAFLEKIDGNTAYISEGGHLSYPSNDYCRIFTCNVSSITSLNSGFIGYVYTGASVPTVGSSTLTVKAGTSHSNTSFSWTKATNAKSYSVRIKNSSGTDYTQWHLTTLSCNVILPAGTYTAYVDASNDYSYLKGNDVTFTVSSSDHSYVSEITKKATCVERGVKTYKCSCGASYTESIPIDSMHHAGLTGTEIKKDYKTHSDTYFKGFYYAYEYKCTACGKSGIIDPGIKSAVVTDIADTELTVRVESETEAEPQLLFSLSYVINKQTPFLSLVQGDLISRKKISDSVYEYKFKLNLGGKEYNLQNNTAGYLTCEFIYADLGSRRLTYYTDSFYNKYAKVFRIKVGQTVNSKDTIGVDLSTNKPFTDTDIVSWQRDPSTITGISPGEAPMLCINNMTGIPTAAFFIVECDHKPVVDKAKSPTCSSAGLTQGSHCSICGEILEKQQPIPATGHKYSSTYTVDKKATCTAVGSKSRHCTVCRTKTGVTEIPATGHSYTSKTTKAATCTEKGVKTYTCKTCGYKTTKSIAAKGHTTVKSVKKATQSANGKITYKCSVCGKVTSTKTIYKIASAAFPTTYCYYNGKVRTPAVTVKDSKGNVLKKDTDYTVKYSSGRKNPGTYKATVTFKGKYSGTKTLTFKIILRAPAFSSLTPGKGKATLKWKAVSGITGYEVWYYSTYSGKYVKDGTTTKTAYNFTDLASGKTYKVKVRAYKTVSGTKYYSAFSPVKTVKAK